MIRPMLIDDKDSVMNMMRDFYSSDAVHTDGSDEIFANDIAACVGDSPYAEGYVFEECGKLVGYAMVAKSFSTEFGKPCIWIEDLYILPEYRARGYGSSFFALLADKYTGAILRLEADESNARAIAVYEKNGFTPMNYVEMKKDI